MNQHILKSNSLRSKRFRASSSRKLGREPKRGMTGEGREGNACPQNLKNCVRPRTQLLTGAVLACVASVSVRFKSKERGTRVKDRAKNGASKKPKVPFRGLSLLRNQTETLATQASAVLVVLIK